MKVFLWACLDSNLNTHSGIAAGTCRDSVLEDVKGKIAGVLYATVHHLPDLFPMLNESGDLVGIGGVDMDGLDAVNPLSYLMLQATIDTQMVQPSLSVRLMKWAHPSTTRTRGQANEGQP